MADFTNLSFETVDMDGVSAAAWTPTVVSSVEDIDKLTPYGVLEGFETGWSGNEAFERLIIVGTNASKDQFTNPVTTVPLFAESFEAGWDQNEAFETALGPDAADSFVGTGSIDTFESGWHSNEAFERVAFGTSTADVFVGAITKEGFEAGWLPAAYETAIVLGTNATAKVWNGARASAKETFEFVATDAPITVVDTTGGHIYDTITPIPLATGYTVRFYSTTGQLPRPIQSNQDYAVFATFGAGDFEIALLGSQIIPTDAGTGLFYVTAPYEFWTVEISI